MCCLSSEIEFSHRSRSLETASLMVLRSSSCDCLMWDSSPVIDSRTALFDSETASLAFLCRISICKGKD